MSIYLWCFSLFFLWQLVSRFAATFRFNSILLLVIAAQYKKCHSLTCRNWSFSAELIKKVVLLWSEKGDAINSRLCCGMLCRVVW